MRYAHAWVLPNDVIPLTHLWLIVVYRKSVAKPSKWRQGPKVTLSQYRPFPNYWREQTEGGDGAPYAEPLRELFERIKKLNSTFIRKQSGVVLAGILQLVIRGVRYIPLSGRCHREVPPYLKANKPIINIQNTDDRCFGYAILWFLDLPRDRIHSNRPLLYTEQMFERNHLADHPYPIPPNNVHLYEDQLQININVFSSFDDEGKARHPLFISKKQYPRTANLLYWDEHYAPITDIPRLFRDISKHNERKNICIRCLESFYNEESLFKHQRLCTRKDYMSVVHVLPAAESEQADIKFKQVRNT